METALEVVGYLSDIRDIDVLIALVVIFRELEIDLLGEEVLEEEVHQLGVLLLLEVIIVEHGDTAHDDHFASLGVLVDGRNRAVAGVSQRP